jgi:hypothetical protein
MNPNLRRKLLPLPIRWGEGWGEGIRAKEPTIASPYVVYSLSTLSHTARTLTFAFSRCSKL